MKTLEEFNREKRAALGVIQDMNRPHLNGIKCPECENELMDSHPMEMLTSNPPQKRIHCPECKYTGLRIA